MRLSAIIRSNCLISICVGLTLIFLSCTQSSQKDEYKFIEYIKVEGTCYEDHVRQSAPYSGSFVHWYNKTEEKHRRYGGVIHTEYVTKEGIRQQIQRPYRYFPPLSVDLWNIPKEQFELSEMTLHGISKHTSEVDSEERVRYESTCRLKVTERLDHLPSIQMPDEPQGTLILPGRSADLSVAPLAGV
jgi:hypothetical protein